MNNNKKPGMPEKPEKPIPASEIKRERTADFVSRYANYSHLESSVWDLKILFGEFDQSAKGAAVPVNASVTLPWAQVKVLAYFLRVHVTAYEADQGRIKIPAGIIPEVPETSAFADVYKEFIEKNPEAAPQK
jgi:uncharacterized protein DUF3467